MENRLNLLCQGNVIDQDICDGMLQVVTQLENDWEIPVRNGLGEMVITHMANALMRSRRGEQIGSMDAELLMEVRQSDAFAYLQAINASLLAQFDVQLHPCEEDYLLANLFSLWAAKESGVARQQR
ncbi:PRD domain-containing protein [Photorhabdus thracensis]|uniref:PRD domain-containing protein n=1 Tax=Photorhabdus thracensis TaxID=230089 RepID=UPI001E4E3909|nr:PRD domain-containing protein [Photorhabdus thracensis]MCC8422271.1 PRD domain-containing protein [Photorhabdus thracensis]